MLSHTLAGKSISLVDTHRCRCTLCLPRCHPNQDSASPGTPHHGRALRRRKPAGRHSNGHWAHYISARVGSPFPLCCEGLAMLLALDLQAFQEQPGLEQVGSSSCCPVEAQTAGRQRLPNLAGTCRCQGSKYRVQSKLGPGISAQSRIVRPSIPHGICRCLEWDNLHDRCSTWAVSNPLHPSRRSKCIALRRKHPYRCSHWGSGFHRQDLCSSPCNCKCHPPHTCPCDCNLLGN